MKRLIAVLIAALFLSSIVLAQVFSDKAPGDGRHKSHVSKVHKTTAHKHLTTHKRPHKVVKHKGKGVKMAVKHKSKGKHVLKLKGKAKHKATRGTAKPTAKPLAK